MRDFWSDLRYAARSLRRVPAFTLVALATLALGIGANAAIFGVVRAVLLAPFPVPALERLALVDMRTAEGFDASLSIPNMRDVLAGARAFEAAGASRGSGAVLTGGDRPERVTTEQVFGDYFAALGVAPLLGRAIAAAETDLGGPQVVVLSHALWERAFARDPAVVGRTISMTGRPFTVVGVMPPRFEAIEGGADAFVPMGAFSGLPWEQRDNGPGISIIGRLRDGATLEAANADVRRIGREIAARAPEVTGTPQARSLRTQLLGETEPALLVLTVAVGLVLLIACANVANLLLARGEGRQRELLVRAALGAGRARLLRQLLAESLLIAVTGGALGVLLAAGAVRALRASVPATVPGADRIALDGTVLLFTLALAVATGLLFGLLPALRASRAGVGLGEGLRDAGRGSGDSRERQRLRGALVVGEVAFAVLLLVGAGLTARSFANLRAVDPGFDPEHVLTVRVAPTTARYPERAQWNAFYDGLLERARALPGVTAAGYGTRVPLAGAADETAIRPEGVPEDQAQSVMQMSVSEGYFSALGLRIVRGRWFTDAEARGPERVAVIDERMAERFWPGQDPIGRRVTYEMDVRPGGERLSNGDPRPEDAVPVWRTVVGVVRNVRHYELQSPSRIQVYRPYVQNPYPITPSLVLFLKTAGDPSALTEPVRRIVRELDPELPIYQVQTVEEVVGAQLATGRLIGGLLSVFGAAALVLAAIGIYGVVSYGVARRTREIGVRLALGARPADVVRLVVGGGGRLALLGVLIGVLGALALSRLIAGLLYGVNPWDPTTFVATPVLLGLTALFAAWLPARRAARTDPAVALSSE